MLRVPEQQIKHRCGTMKQSYIRKPSPKRKSFHQVADGMLIPVLEFDEKFVLTYANLPAREILQLNDAVLKEDILVRDLVVPEQISQVVDGLRALRNGMPSL